MFITNKTNERSLLEVIKKSIPKCSEIKIIVGYFYFSGLNEFIDLILENKNLKLKILVGMKTDIIDDKIIEIEEDSLNNKNKSAIKEEFFESIRKNFVNKIFDNEEFYNSFQKFKELLKENRLEIRKTRENNHSKVYIFKMNKENEDLLNGFFITGSSNLTKPGLKEQNEFNVKISDYGFREANQYFDNLWESSIELSVEDINKIFSILENESLLKKITPFEAYLYTLKTYLDSFQKKEVSQSLEDKLIKASYKDFAYQKDAIGQALSILEKHNGVIIADVVGLGKSIIGSAIAYELKERGIVIAPPGLIGEDDASTGWNKYIEDFGLAAIGWKTFSIGKLDEAKKFIDRTNDVNVIIIDEAHRFRNQETQSYELLKEICRNKKVILLTATPFNNSPSDIFSLLKLFIIPKKSDITFDLNLERTFTSYKNRYDKLLYIKKNYKSNNPKKQKQAKEYFKEFFGNKKNSIDTNVINHELKKVSSEIKSVLSTIMIRRNRLDLLKHPDYKKEVEKNIPKVADPKTGYFELTAEQSNFYDQVIQTHFYDPFNSLNTFDTLVDDIIIDRTFIQKQKDIELDERTFVGTIYMPFIFTDKDVNDEFTKLFQTNLFGLMRRLLVKRFESSFGSFYQTIENFIDIHKTVKDFVLRSNYYVLDRDWINKISELDDEEFFDEVKRKISELENAKTFSKKDIVYKMEDLGSEFLASLDSDIELLEYIKERMQELNLLESDPKADTIAEKLLGSLQREPNRKIIVFSEFADTVEHFKNYTSKKYKELHKRILFASKNISKELYQTILDNFDASREKSLQKNDYDILVCTDKFSEGFNLNRSGFIINYDIPWNPVRVIQRLGRINRIGKKVFDELYIMNFFPTQKGESEIKQRTIAESKMFMIHNSIGEDAKIFSPDEEPQPSELFTRLNKNPDQIEEESTYTKVYIEFNNYKQKYPEIINKLDSLPPRIKVSKPSQQNELFVIIRKNNLFYLKYNIDNKNNEPVPVTFEELWSSIKAEPDTPALELSDAFWNAYYLCINYEKNSISEYPKNSNTQKAINKLREFYLKQNINESLKNFIELLIQDIEEFGTLSDKTIKDIAQCEKPDDLENIKKLLGEKYIKDFYKNVKSNKDIVIAIENQNNLLQTKTSNIHQ